MKERLNELISLMTDTLPQDYPDALKVYGAVVMGMYLGVKDPQKIDKLLTNLNLPPRLQNTLSISADLLFTEEPERHF